MSSENQLNIEAGLSSPGQANPQAQAPEESTWDHVLRLLHLKGANSGTCEPSKEYEQYIENAAQRLYEPAKMGDISQLEHKYDCQIHSVDDAVKYANQALAIVDDPFTKVMSASEVQVFQEHAAGDVFSIGIVAFNHGPSDAYQPMHAPLFVNEVYPGSPAEKAGIKAGDKILQIDGHDTANLSPHQSWDLIGGKAGTSVNLVIQDGANVLHQDVVRDKVNIPVVEDKDLGHDIAYIKLSDFVADSGVAAMSAALKKHSNARAFVIDMRDNLGGDVGHTLATASLFVKEGGLVTINTRQAPQLSPLDYLNEKTRLPKLVANPGYNTDKISLTPQNLIQTIDGHASVSQRQPYLIDDKPVVILTNGYTASGGEMFTGAVHDSGKATVIGERTYGKGIGQTYLTGSMPNGTGEKVTSLHYLTPSGLWPGDAYKHRIGIKPDIEVKNPVYAIPMSVDDRQLNAAVQFLEKKLSRP